MNVKKNFRKYIANQGKCCPICYTEKQVNPFPVKYAIVLVLQNLVSQNNAKMQNKVMINYKTIMAAVCSGKWTIVITRRVRPLPVIYRELIKVTSQKRLGTKSGR